MHDETVNKADIGALRQRLFATLDAVKAGTLDLDRAHAVNAVAKTLVDTARVEVDFLRATGADGSAFLAAPKDDKPLPPGITGVTTHRLKG